MANYHMEIKPISRGKGQSVTRIINYISGERLYDSYSGNTYYRQRTDVLYHNIFLPPNAPSDYHNLQYLCNEIEAAEKRYDARTGRIFIGSLPNELSLNDWCSIVKEFVECNFVNYGLCSIVAIHEGRNEAEPSRNNPHVHIIVPTRAVESDSFSQMKDREHDKRKYINIWREHWAHVQNMAYERNRFDIRVSHESLEVQGIFCRKPTHHLNYRDWQEKIRYERAPIEKQNHRIKIHDKECYHNRQLELDEECSRNRQPELDKEYSRNRQLKWNKKLSRSL